MYMNPSHSLDISFFGVSFPLGVKKGLRRDKCSLEKISNLSCGEIGKAGKYWGNIKPEKTKNRGVLVPQNLNFVKKNE